MLEIFTCQLIFSADNIIQLGILFIGIISLWLAYRMFLRNQLRTKQLDAVCALVNQIHNDYNLVMFNDPKNNKGWHFTLFDIAESNEFDEFNKFYTLGLEDKEYAVQSEKTLEDMLRWDFFKFYNNPLIPKSIAAPLQKFNIWHWKSINYKDIKETKCILMGNKGMLSDDTNCFYYDDKITAKEFRQICKNLQDAILKWAKKYGIKDLNVSTSHHKKLEIKTIKES